MAAVPAAPFGAPAQAVANGVIANAAEIANLAGRIANLEVLVVDNHAAVMAEIGATRAAADANHVIAIANHVTAMAAIGASRAAADANHVIANANHVTAMAAKDDILMSMDKVIPANTIQAHLLIQMHAALPSATAVVERLFKAYFEEGLNVDDPAILERIHFECGGDAGQWSMREHPQWRKDLEKDLHQAAQMGVRGVPFTYFENHFTISGAQEPRVFEQAVAQLMAQ
jgi:hypothetical protein